MKRPSFVSLPLFLALLVLSCLLASCAPTVDRTDTYSGSKVNPAFQTQMSPIPTPPSYTCGAWSTPNNPSTYSTITVHAKLTKNVAGVPNISATATAHLQYGDVPLDQHPVSDKGGYVTFFFSLAGRQPYLQPATIDVAFALKNTTIHCSAFFTPD
jgi:hypothetical protein